jgi:hypothetical protein
MINNFAGDGGLIFTADGIPATASSIDPFSVAVDNSGNVYITDQINNRLRKVTAGIINTVCGNGTGAFAGDGGPATDGVLNSPAGVNVDNSGNIYITDYQNYRVRKISPSNCTGTPSGGTTIATPATGCRLFTSALSLSGASTLPGIAYSWQFIFRWNYFYPCCWCHVCYLYSNGACSGIL